MILKKSLKGFGKKGKKEKKGPFFSLKNFFFSFREKGRKMEGGASGSHWPRGEHPVG